MNNFLGQDHYLFETYKNVQSKIENKPIINEEANSTTSIKYQEITQSPLGLKKVIQLPGIGPSTSVKMNEKGVEFAYQLIGIYLSLNNENDFKNYLKNEFSINKKYIICITSVINEYLNTFYDNKNDKLVDQVLGYFLENKMDNKKLAQKYPNLNFEEFNKIVSLLLGI